MKSQSKRFVFDTARAEDSSEILEILEETDFDGLISLTYTRRPDPYVSFNLEGEDTVIVLCRDAEKNKIAGFGACCLRKVYINGEESKTGYLFGMRIRKEYRKLYPIIPKGYDLIREAYKEKDINYFITTILAENIYAQKVLGKKRTFMPGYHLKSDYGTFILKTGRRYKESYLANKSGFKLKQAESHEIPAVLCFMNEEGRKNQFFPVVDREWLSAGQIPGLSEKSIMIMYDEKSKICACGIVWDQKGYKQYILNGYGGILKFLYSVSRVFELFGYPALPAPGGIVDFFTLSFWLVRDNKPEIFKAFISLLSEKVTSYPFFAIGISSENPLIKIASQLRHISYWSKVYLVDLNNKGTHLNINRDLPLYLECSML